MKSVSYILKDARDLKTIFKKRKFNNPSLILTSPPYYNVKNYGDYINQVGFNQSYDEYLTDLVNIFQQCYNVSCKNASLWMVVDTIRINGTTITLPFDIINKMKEYYSTDTWLLKDVIVWNKYKNIPWNAKGRFKNMFEYILFFTKSSKYKYNIDRVRNIANFKKWWLTYPERYNSNGSAPTNIWEFNIPIRGWGNGYQKHLCPFPFPLIEKILTISSDKDDLILDPFAGSGSVLAMAKVMQRKAIGFDLNENYKNKFEEEVLIGAEKYWEKREYELKNIKNNLDNFKKINKKLRKLKACVQIANSINEKSNYKYKLFAINSNRNSVKLIIINKNNALKKLKLDEEISYFHSKYKVDIDFLPYSKKHFMDEFSKIKNLYGYDEDQIYKYKSKISTHDLLEDDVFENTIYSNIALDLNRSLDVLKNITN